MGLIHEWSRIAGLAPWLANAMLQAPGISAIAKRVGGIAPQRQIPRYARKTFVQWFTARPHRQRGPRVVLWPDTFNNYFRPETAIAAVEALEGFGYAVDIPRRTLCCGRPLYDWGWLDRAKALWRNTLTVLRSEIQRGTPIIGLEPACVSAFRDELPALFPGDEQAKRLSAQTLLLTEFLDKHAADAQMPEVRTPALVQFHCHHHAVLDREAERRVLHRLGVDYEILKSGCCGMAGAFGFESAKYDVSMAAAERVLLPAVRQAPEATLILADGFSCREQIEQGSSRKALHIAELIASGLRPRLP
jgi:Fe-S oxidoreductase